MLQVVDIKTANDTMYRKDEHGQNSIQRDEVSLAQQRGRRKARKQANFLFSTGLREQIVPPNYNFATAQCIRHTQLLIKSPSTNILPLFCLLSDTPGEEQRVGPETR